MTKTKTCSTCKLIKPLTEMAVDNQRRDGRSSYCIICRKENNRRYYLENKELYHDSHLRRTHNLSLMEYRDLLEKQDGCITTMAQNSWLGAFKDAPRLLRIAADYLEGEKV